jgi:hypothetical protein
MVQLSGSNEAIAEMMKDVDGTLNEHGIKTVELITEHLEEAGFAAAAAHLRVQVQGWRRRLGEDRRP